MKPPASGRDQEFSIDGYEPVALSTWRAGGLDDKVTAAREELAHCLACPRDCGVNRLLDERGVCHTGRWPYVASAFPHFGEEDCLRGRSGSGTIFFSFCNLKCVFCQNWDISSREAGQELTAEELADLMLRLQAAGCHNINLVTPEHVAPQLVEAIALAVPSGLRLPIVYNTSAYDAIRSLELMDGLVDIYMPDFKLWEPESCRRLLRAEDYPDRARAAVEEMQRQVGVLKLGSDGLARCGLLVRHLVMPGHVDESAAIFRWLHDRISPDTYLNIMGQYRPEHRVPGSERYDDIDRRPQHCEWMLPSPPPAEPGCGVSTSAGVERLTVPGPVGRSNQFGQVSSRRAVVRVEGLPRAFCERDIDPVGCIWSPGLPGSQWRNRRLH